MQIKYKYVSSKNLRLKKNVYTLHFTNLKTIEGTKLWMQLIP